ncbi:thioredoxin domain-containing protein [Patescibacteria group bacterium]|nr:thioredoxin domain-containing protein [Patescibacteria group bacterium]
MKNPWVIIGIIVVVLVGGSVWYSGYAAEKNNVGVETGTRHIKGGEGATVTLLEYSDFQCPACNAFQPVIQDVLNEFGDDVAFEYKHFPLTAIHPFAEPAARAAEAAGQQGKFFEYHDKLFAEQAVWSRGPNPTAFFMRYADELGLDVDQFGRHMRSSLLRDEVKADAADAMAAQITGTPTFFLNGVRMEIETYEDFYEQIARAVDPSYGMASTTDEVATPPAAVRFGL